MNIMLNDFWDIVASKSKKKKRVHQTKYVTRFLKQK
jgi:hypothetical protein